MYFMWVTRIHKITVNNDVNEISLFYFSVFILFCEMHPLFFQCVIPLVTTMIINEKLSDAEEKKMKGGRVQKRKC